MRRHTVLAPIDRLAKPNTDLVMGLWPFTDAVLAAAAANPDINFAVVDTAIAAPPANVAGLQTADNEGSFLVGVLAALASQTGKVGFVGGMDIPLIRKFACGYAQGAKHANPEVEVIQNMTGTTPAAWNNPGKGAELGGRHGQRYSKQPPGYFLHRLQ